jgi:hypothetical protein
VRYLTSPSVHRVAAALVLVSAAAWVPHVVAAFVETRHAPAWPTVIGHVTSASVRRHPRLTSAVSYEPVIRYRYTVHGRAYAGTRLGLGRWETTDSALVHSVMLAYAVGASVRVYYDPADPAVSALKPTPHPTRWRDAILCALGLWVGVVGVVRRRDRSVTPRRVE